MYVVIDDRISSWRKIVGVFRTIKKVNNAIRTIWKVNNDWRKKTGSQTYTLGEFKKYFYIKNAVIDEIEL